MAVLEALADGPQSLSALARDLEISAATAHAVLARLAESAWVQRDSATRRFSLGPSFLALAHRSLAPDASVPALLSNLAIELGMAVSVSARHADVLVVVHSAAPDGVQPPMVGQHTPYAVPFGPVFAAFDGVPSQAAWLGRSGELRPDVVEALEQRLTAIREQGFSVERLGPSALRLVQVLQDVRIDGSSAALQPLMQALLSEIVQIGLGPGPGRHPVSTIAVPVRGQGGVVAQTLNAHPFRSMTAPAAAKTATRLMATASALEADARMVISGASPSVHRNRSR